MIYGHGDDLYRYGNQVKINFSSNIFAHADLTALINHLAGRLDIVGSYPEPEPLTLEKLIADEEGVERKWVMVTAGATEAIYLIAQLYRGWASVIPQPTFSEYEDACKQHGHVLSYYDNELMEHLPEERLYWLCNPNNPTGNVMRKGLVNYVVRHHPQYIYVVDQSYEDYTDMGMLKASEMTDCHNLLVLHSMTKRFCVPGLRLGYVTGSPVILDRLRQLRQPWSVNALALEAGRFLVENHFMPIADLKVYLDEARRLQDLLMSIEGVTVLGSHSTFMLCRLENGEAALLKKWLMDNYGILIRDASNFRGLDRRYFRVAAQSKDEDDMLVAAVKEYLNGTSCHFKRYW